MNRLALVAILALTSCASSSHERRGSDVEYAARYEAACRRMHQFAPPSPKVEGTATNGAPTGSLPREDIRRVIGSRIHEVRQCYETALSAWPSAQGRLRIKFVIGPTGTVEQVGFGRNELGVEPIACCIGDALSQWTFPSPGDGIVVVDYEFLLEAQ